MDARSLPGVGLDSALAGHVLVVAGLRRVLLVLGGSGRFSDDGVGWHEHGFTVGGGQPVQTTALGAVFLGGLGFFGNQGERLLLVRLGGGNWRRLLQLIQRFNTDGSVEGRDAGMSHREVGGTGEVSWQW